MLSVFQRYTYYDYPFGICKLFLVYNCLHYVYHLIFWIMFEVIGSRTNILHMTASRVIYQGWHVTKAWKALAWSHRDWYMYLILELLRECRILFYFLFFFILLDNTFAHSRFDSKCMCFHRRYFPYKLPQRKWQIISVQSNSSYVTFQENSEIWSHKTGGHLIQV